MRQAVLVEPKHIEFREVEAPKASASERTSGSSEYKTNRYLRK